MAWLEATRGPAEWARVLAVLGDAPLLAAAADPSALLATAGEMSRELEALAGGGGDATASAERWTRAELPLRLACFENWLTERIRAGLVPEDAPPELRASAHSGTRGPTIKETFELLDAVRELRSSLDAPLNRSVALEALLRRRPPRRAA